MRRHWRWIIVGGLVCWIASGAMAAGRGEEDMVGFMKLSIAPIKSELDALRAEIRELKAAIETLKTPMKDLQDEVKSVAKEIRKLQPADRWQYLIDRGKSEKRANELGQQGWQLLTTTVDGWFIFCKPTRSRSERTPEAME